VTPASVTILAPIFITALGLVVGSFLNVCIYRLPLSKSIVRPGSACARCGRLLAWFENIPIVSYVALRGRCRSCGERISLRYPTIEAITSAMFALGWWYYGPGVLLASRLVLGCALIVLFEIDRQHQILPHAITLPGIAAGFAFSFFTDPGWVSSLAGIVIGGGTLLAIGYGYYFLRHEEGLGMGDFKMLAMIGAFLGWKLVLVTLMFSSIAGAVIGLLVIVLRRGDLKYALPYGTFLSLAGLIASLYGDRIVTWYVGLYGG
jgi:leader peptidase (prepilin peptidase)/N-methyltransferase